ncbi:hypothetical protein SOVF_202250 [Spinacia oleracea]|uniref:Small ubiquitin-related modifier 1-like n=1 Tax=Spinacia oleracea TaxID=3562 RepID=A0A9R0J4T0_SPIOL|nr:small ubiquitin-related modifier 1-like [Spinacia oleracea]XP_021860016.1 small ubiquitin-related modifier 1-like [Spinacia oleracea]KNA04163.1 hypothetical protein SOVF_202250 [Spinacia oleracea]
MAEKRKITSEGVALKQQNTGDSSNSNPGNSYVRIKFVTQENEETYFKVLRDAKLQKAFDAYYRHHKLIKPLTFTFDGLRVNPNLTADDLNLKDGDALDIFGYMSGGGCILFHGSAIP